MFKRMVLELLASLHERDRDNEALRHRLNLLLRRLYGPRGERFDPNQPLLFAEMAEGQDTAAAAPISIFSVLSCRMPVSFPPASSWPMLG